ncbi:ATP-binding protein [Pseudomonas sp. F1_0610]|uniref:ATP-binding protein n=1 Tax=Pseudomonas sp. F1_0610 TaxID=3114284 RepID=UPI0039C3A991
MNKWLAGSISRHTFFVSLVPALLVALLLTSYFSISRIKELHSEIERTGIALAEQFAASAEYSIISGNQESLKSLLDSVYNTPNVVCVKVFNREQQLVEHIDTQTEFKDAVFTAEILHHPLSLKDSFLPTETSTLAPEYLGYVSIAMTKQHIRAQQIHIILRAIFLTAFALIITGIIAFKLAKGLATPITQLSVAIKDIQKSQPNPVTLPEYGGEIGELAQHIEHLSKVLEHSKQQQRQSIQKLSNAYQEAEQANKAKSDFLAMMSHELRTPMNGVLGMLQLLESTHQDSEQKNYTMMAITSCQQFVQVINDILDYTRFEHSPMHIERVPFSPAKLVNELIEMFTTSAQQKGLSLISQTQPGLAQLTMKSDPVRLKQILTNLIGNAIKFTDSGTVILETSWVYKNAQSLELVFKVTDTGIGIAREHQADIFSPFNQADITITRRYGGTGLGLTIARNLAEQMNGSLILQSTLGQGSCFTFRVPVTLLQSTAYTD